MKKNITVENYTPQVNRTVKVPQNLHPSERLAASIVKWLDKGNAAPSIVLAHGLYLSRIREDDGLPVDFLRSHVRTLESDTKLIRELMEELRKPNVDRQKTLAIVFKHYWAEKKPSKKVTDNRNFKDKKPVGKSNFKKTYAK